MEPIKIMATIGYYSTVCCSIEGWNADGIENYKKNVLSSMNWSDGNGKPE